MRSTSSKALMTLAVFVALGVSTAALNLSCTTEDGSSDKGLAPIIRTPLREDKSTSLVPSEDWAKKWAEFYKTEFVRGDTLIVAQPSAPNTVNPLYSNFDVDSLVMSLVFDGFHHLNPDFSRSGALAETWSVSDDKKSVTFNLRKDIRWHDGQPITTADFEFTYQRQIDDEVQYKARRAKHRIERLEVHDAHTITYHFKEPSLHVLFDSNVGFPIPKHIWEKIPSTEMRTASRELQAIGSGPYKIAEWKADEYIVLEANKDYYGGEPALTRIVFKTMPSSQARILALRTGEVDAIMRVNPGDFDALRTEKHLAFYEVPDRRYYWIGWNQGVDLFKSVNVRRAMTMAIDREQLSKALFGGYARIIHGPVSPLLWGYNPEVEKIDPSYDVEAAKKLLEAEGWIDSDGDGIRDKDGVRFSFKMTANGSNVVKADTIAYVKEMLRKVGVEVIEDLIGDLPYQSRLVGKDFDSVVGGWSVATKMDMSTVWSTKGPYNLVGFASDRVDAICLEATQFLDIEKAKPLWHEAQKIVVTAQPYTFLYEPKQLNVIHKRFRNVQAESLGWQFNVEQWWSPKDEHRQYKK